MRVASRRSRVSGRFAVVIQCTTAFRYDGACFSQNAQGSRIGPERGQLLRIELAGVLRVVGVDRAVVSGPRLERA
jgi:hypothetical protein